MLRRAFLGALSATALPAAAITPRQRLDRVLEGRETDRPAFTFWYHFGLEKHPGERHAQATLGFHRKFRTDLVKVMSDYPYPRAAGKWYELREEKNPFPEQIRALDLIRDGLEGQAHFIETIFNPWNMAEKLSSKEQVRALMAEKPQALLDALAVIARSQANHARRARAAGASGIFLAIANAVDGVLTPAEYAKFSEPFDRMVIEAARTAPLSTLHLHGDKVFLDRFWKGWPAAAVSYSVHGTGLAAAQARQRFAGILMCGLDERNFRNLTAPEMKRQWITARTEAGARLVLAPGCSVPNETTDNELLRVPRLFGVT